MKKHHKAKADPQTVELARKMHESGIGPKEISERLNVPKFTIYDWVYYKTRHDTDLQV